MDKELETQNAVDPSSLGRELSEEELLLTTGGANGTAAGVVGGATAIFGGVAGIALAPLAGPLAPIAVAVGLATIVGGAATIWGVAPDPVMPGSDGADGGTEHGC